MSSIILLILAGTGFNVAFHRDLFSDLCSFLIYVNDLPKLVSNISIHVLFADVTSIPNSIPNNFQTSIKEVFENLHKWFSLNLLSLNFDKTNFVHFKMRKTCSLCMKNEYDNGLTIRFHGITVDSTLYWRGHLDQLVLDLSAVYYIHDRHLPIFCFFYNLIRHL
jgi:hypothetical protein